MSAKKRERIAICGKRALYPTAFQEISETLRSKNAIKILDLSADTMSVFDSIIDNIDSIYIINPDIKLDRQLKTAIDYATARNKNIYYYQDPNQMTFDDLIPANT